MIITVGDIPSSWIQVVDGVIEPAYDGKQLKPTAINE